MILSARDAGRGGGLRVRADLRPLPPVDRPAGAEPLRLGSPRGDRRRRPSGSDRHRRDVPDDPYPPGDRRAGGGDHRSDAARPVLPRRRHRREPQRARRSAQRWPVDATRREMLEEAVEVMRLLWSGELSSHRGRHYTVENARIYTLPDEPRRCESRPRAERGGGARRPHRRRADRDGARRGDSSRRSTRRAARASRATARSPCAGRSDEERHGGPRSSAGRTPRSRGRSARNCRCRPTSKLRRAWSRRTHVAEAIVCGPDPEPYAKAIDEYLDAGYTHVYLHQVGADQEGFFRFYESQLQPRYATLASSAR